MPTTPPPAPSALLRRASWTTLAPPLALVVLALVWSRDLSPPVAALVAVPLVAAVLSAVHHAEVVAHRVGEPLGSLVLALAVTVIEVALIVALVSGGGPESATLARDTVFAAVMICCNGIVGLCLVTAALRHRVAMFNAEGTGGAFATVLALCGLCLVAPAFTRSRPGPEFAPAQLVFAAVCSVALYGLFVAVQTVRHRDYFLPVRTDGAPVEDGDEHAAPPSAGTALRSAGLLVLALVAVVGLAKSVSHVIEDAVASAGLPHAVVGIVIALLVLLPETLAAARAARRDRVQTSLNLAYGSAMASIGLTIPAMAVASVFLPGPLVLGLAGVEVALLALTAAVSVLTIVPGRATLLQGGVHLALLLAFVFFAG